MCDAFPTIVPIVNQKSEIVNALRCCGWKDVIHVLNDKVGKRNDCRGFASRADKDANGANGKGWVADAELKTSIQEETNFFADCPDPNADSTRRARRDVSAGDGLLQGEPYAVADSFRADSSIAGEGEAKIRTAIRADEHAVAVFAFAQAGLGSDLGIVVGEQGVAAQAGHVDLFLYGKRQAVVINGGTGLVGGGNLPVERVGEIVGEEIGADAGAHLWGGGFGGQILGRRRGRWREPDNGRGGKRGFRHRQGCAGGKEGIYGRAGCH